MFNGTLSGSGSLLKNGAGRFTLNGSHSMSGLSTIGQGTFALNGSVQLRVRTHVVTSNHSTREPFTLIRSCGCAGLGCHRSSPRL